MIMKHQNEYDDDIIDPMYKIFLEHLREDGTSYVLDIIDGDGSRIIIRYDEDCELSNTVAGENCSLKSEHSNGTANSEPSSQDSESQLIFFDHNYQQFLNRIKVQDKHMVLEWENNVIRYEDIGTCDLSSHKTLFSRGKHSIPRENATQQPVFYSESEEERNGCMLTDEIDDSQLYEKKLMSVLSKPYSQNEYEELLKLATERKPSIKLRHLRSDSVPYVTKKKGMSYLDHHPDLAAQIKEADCRTTLKLLRGFFFWLSHSSHEGSYAPWTSQPSRSMKLSPLGI